MSKRHSRIDSRGRGVIASGPEIFVATAVPQEWIHIPREVMAPREAAADFCGLGRTGTDPRVRLEKCRLDHARQVRNSANLEYRTFPRYGERVVWHPDQASGWPVCRQRWPSGRRNGLFRARKAIRFPDFRAGPAVRRQEKLAWDDPAWSKVDH